MTDPLQAILAMSDGEKQERGLVHTPREIFQQPESWCETYRRCREKETELSQFLNGSGIGSPGPLPTVLLVGAGTSDYVGRSLAPILRRQWRCETWAVPSTDLLTDAADYLIPSRPQLWISFSRSGDSSEGVAVLQRALEHHPEVRHLVVTCNQAGAMVKACASYRDKALALILDESVNDRGLAMTSSFSNMIIAGHCLAHLGLDLDAYGKRLDQMAQAGTRFLPLAAQKAACLAKLGFSKACFVGTGALAAAARESALKLLEMTAGKIHTMSESVLGLRHGPMSALDDETLLVLFLSNDPIHRKYELDLLREIRAKKLGKATTVVAPQENPELHSLAGHVLSLDLPAACADEYRPPLDVIFGQLLGLFCSIHAGLQPDHPSPNGAITRVVSHVNIYS